MSGPLFLLHCVLLLYFGYFVDLCTLINHIKSKSVILNLYASKIQCPCDFVDTGWHTSYLNVNSSVNFRNKRRAQPIEFSVNIKCKNYNRSPL